MRECCFQGGYYSASTQHTKLNRHMHCYAEFLYLVSPPRGSKYMYAQHFIGACLAMNRSLKIPRKNPPSIVDVRNRILFSMSPSHSLKFGEPFSLV